MQKHRIIEIGNQIYDSTENSDFYNLIDQLSYKNSLLIFLTDKDGKTIYSSDEYSKSYNSEYSYHQYANENPYRKNETMDWEIGQYRNLPDNYSEFLDKLGQSDNEYICYPTENNTILIYGRVLKDDKILYINTTLGAVSSAIEILRKQLLIVIVFSLILSAVISYFMSKRFAKPIADITTKAEKMISGTIDNNFRKGFCDELDKLSDTIDKTAEQLKKNEQQRRDMLANISHDLRTPVTMIKGYAELVKEDVQDENAEDLDIIIRESERLANLINDILDYSAMQSANCEMEKVKFNISNLASEVIMQFHVLCESKEIHIDSEIVPDLYVIGNQQRISQVFYNLIANAVTHIGEDKQIFVNIKQQTQKIRIEVRDNGEGIAEKDIPHIWERYFTSSQRKRSTIGTGLGLSIVKEILTQHKADFGVISKVGKGSTFWFEL